MGAVSVRSHPGQLKPTTTGTVVPHVGHTTTPLVRAGRQKCSKGINCHREMGWALGPQLTDSRASFDGWSSSAPGPASCPIAAAGSAKVVAPVAGSNQKRFPSGVADRNHVPVKVPVVAATPPPSEPWEPEDGRGGSIGPVTSVTSATKFMSPGFKNFVVGIGIRVGTTSRQESNVDQTSGSSC